MNMSRKSFIGGSLALGASALPLAAPAEARKAGNGPLDEREADVFVAGRSMTGVFAAIRAAAGCAAVRAIDEKLPIASAYSPACLIKPRMA